MVEPKLGQYKERFSWDTIECAVDNLIEHITEAKKKYMCIYGIPRGGLIPAVMLSHKLNIPVVQKVQDMHPTMTLVVDDINDSGQTLHNLTQDCQHLLIEKKTFDTAVLTSKQSSKFKPTFFGLELMKQDPWIIFPWEGK